MIVSHGRHLPLPQFELVPPSPFLFGRFPTSPPDDDEQNDYGQNTGTDSNHRYGIHILPLSLLDLHCVLRLQNRRVAAITLGTPDKW